MSVWRVWLGRMNSLRASCSSSGTTTASNGGRRVTRMTAGCLTRLDEQWARAARQLASGLMIRRRRLTLDEESVAVADAQNPRPRRLVTRSISVAVEGHLLTPTDCGVLVNDRPGLTMLASAQMPAAIPTGTRRRSHTQSRHVRRCPRSQVAPPVSHAHHAPQPGPRLLRTVHCITHAAQTWRRQPPGATTTSAATPGLNCNRPEWQFQCVMEARAAAVRRETP